MRVRASHEATRNRGTYPANGAERVLMLRGDAEALVETDGDWSAILRDVRAGDWDRYETRRLG